MQRLLEKHRFADVDRALRYLAIRLGSRPETTPLKAPVDDARAALREREETYQGALQARVAASAEIEYLDGRLDELVMDIARETLALTRGDRNDARYLKLFATAPSAAMAPIAGEAQDLYVRNIVSRLGDPELEPLHHHHDELVARHAALATALDKRRALSVPESVAAADRRAALENGRRIYNRMESQLRLVLDDETLVKSYFISLSARARESADDDTPSDQG